MEPFNITLAAVAVELKVVVSVQMAAKVAEDPVVTVATKREKMVLQTRVGVEGQAVQVTTIRKEMAAQVS